MPERIEIMQKVESILNKGNETLQGKKELLVDLYISTWSHEK